MKDSVGAWAERLERCGGVVRKTVLQREKEYVEEKNKEIASLEDRVFMFSSKDKQKKVRAEVMSHSLELWGFEKKQKGD